MLLKSRLLLLIIVFTFLWGCGGGDNDSNSDVDNSISDVIDVSFGTDGSRKSTFSETPYLIDGKRYNCLW